MPHEKNEYYIHKLQLDAADHTTEESIKYWKGHFDYLQNRIAECQNIIASPNQTQEAIDKEKFAINTLTQDTRDTVQKLINLGYHEILNNKKMILWDTYPVQPTPDNSLMADLMDSHNCTEDTHLDDNGWLRCSCCDKVLNKYVS